MSLRTSRESARPRRRHSPTFAFDRHGQQAPPQEGLHAKNRKLLAASRPRGRGRRRGGAAARDVGAGSAPAATAATPQAARRRRHAQVRHRGRRHRQLDPNTINFAGQAPLQTLLYNGLAKYDRNMNVDSRISRPSGGVARPEDVALHAPQGREVLRPAGTFTADDARANILRVLDPRSRRSSARTRRTSAPSACINPTRSGSSSAARAPCSRTRSSTSR